MIAACLVQYHSRMSGLPKAKYEKLSEDIELVPRQRCPSTCSVQSFLEDLSTDQTPGQQDSLIVADDTVSSRHRQALQLEGDDMADVPRNSIDRLFSLNSSLDQENDSSEHISAQFYDVFHRVSSLHSESWFTASSLMGESTTNSTDMPPKMDRCGSLNDRKQEEEQTARPANLMSPCPTEQRALSQRRTAELHRRITVADAGNMSSTDELQWSTRTTQDPFVPRRRQWQQSGRAYSTEGSLDEKLLENLMIPPRMSSPTSPAKLLRMRWKKLFSPKHSEHETSPLPHSPTGHPRSRRSGQLKKTLNTTKLDVENQQVSVPTEDFPGTPLLHGAPQSSRSTRSGPVSSEASYSLPYNIEDKLHSEQVNWEKRERPVERLKVSHSCARFGSPYRTRRKWRTNRTSLPSPDYFDSIGPRLHFVGSVPVYQSVEYRLNRQQSDPTEDVSGTEFGEQATEETDRLGIPGLPHEYKTSFERDEEVSENLIEREAHIGAFALAWATTNRKPKQPVSRTPSAGVSTDRPIDSARASQLIAETVDRGFLGKPIAGTISNQILGAIQTGKDRTDGAETPKQAIPDAVQQLSKTTAQISAVPVNLSIPWTYKSKVDHGRSPHKRTGNGRGEHRSRRNESKSMPGVSLRSAIPRFHWRFTPGTRSASTKQLTTEHIEDEELSSPAVTPSCTRTHSRRGAQDIPLLRSTGGPLSLAQQPLIQKTQAHNIGWRLSQRKLLNEQRRKLADYSFVLAVIGILLMVFNLEFVINNVYEKNSIYCLLMKALISASTVVLVGLMVFYHVIDIKLFSVNNCIEDWRIATNCKKISFVLLEVILCMIHPPPIISNYDWPFQDTLPLQNNHIPIQHRSISDPTTDFNSSTIQPILTTVPTPCPHPPSSPTYSEHMRLEHALSIPMFFRLFLIFRVLLLHSSFFTDAGSRSIGALNRVKINVRFVLKTLATAQPGTMLLIFIMFMWIITSWIMRICEREQNVEYERMFNTMWLIAVTFLSIGYGDMVPHTYCGRSISVIAGVMGSACTALVVAVVARKLELSRAEKHVHNFMQDNKVYKQLRHSAANVLRETWLFYKHTRLVKRVNASRVRRHQRKFLAAINRLRKAKDDQRKLKEDANSMVDLAKLQTGIHEVVTFIRNDQAIFVQRLVSVEKCLTQLQVQLSQLPATLTELLQSPNRITETQPAQEISDDDCPSSFNPANQSAPTRSLPNL
ncbi:Small conductance calcium-activated potassium channel protein [Clonorchis sinensis]|uniref:Small conductance calcium-activated potassium channel protein n=2 Tax=Clonorchis sinensis TaxID=79923 RepID=A0A8T1MTL8_CLOSI|nr:Small conductance calcium-activated potassium channel protein [Clonorchis sinensis]